MVEIRALESARQEATGIRMVLLAVWYWTSGHISLTIALFGVGCVLIGAIVMEHLNATLAGMLGIWGTSFFILGILFDIAFRVIAYRQKQKS